jgi:hypothetical protein
MKTARPETDEQSTARPSYTFKSLKTSAMSTPNSLFMMEPETSIAQVPQADTDSRDLSPEEQEQFTKLGYSPSCRAWMSKSMANHGRWFIGEKRAFGCWLDTPIKAGYVLTHDGRQVPKEELSQPYYKPWANDQNTNYHSFIQKRLDRAVGIIEEHAKFLIALETRTKNVEEFLEAQFAPDAEMEGGEFTDPK